MSAMEFLLPDASATQRLGRAIAELIPGGTVVAMTGDLGVGKTTLIRALAQRRGVAPGEIGSPTFAIAHEYACDGGGRVVHVDAYRLESSDQLDELGWHEWVADASTVLCVEWADRVADHIDQAVRIELRHCEQGRWVMLDWPGAPQSFEASVVAESPSGDTP